MPSLQHQLIIQRLPLSGTKGFYRALSNFFDDEFSRERYGIIPDGYRVDQVKQENGTILRVTAYEVHLHHPFPDRRLLGYAALAFDLDSISDWYELHLVIVDHNANEFRISSDELIAIEFDQIVKSVGEPNISQESQPKKILAPVRPGSVLDELRQDGRRSQ